MTKLAAYYKVERIIECTDGKRFAERVWFGPSDKRRPWTRERGVAMGVARQVSKEEGVLRADVLGCTDYQHESLLMSFEDGLKVAVRRHAG